MKFFSNWITENKITDIIQKYTAKNIQDILHIASTPAGRELHYLPQVKKEIDDKKIKITRLSSEIIKNTKTLYELLKDQPEEELINKLLFTAYQNIIQNKQINYSITAKFKNYSQNIIELATIANASETDIKKISTFLKDKVDLLDDAYELIKYTASFIGMLSLLKS